MSRSSSLRTRPRLNLAGPPFNEQFQVGAPQNQEYSHPVRQFADSGAGVVRHVRGYLVLGDDVGGKVPQRCGHGPRTHGLPMHAREFAVGSMVDHGAQHGFVRRRASAHPGLLQRAKGTALIYPSIQVHWHATLSRRVLSDDPVRNAHAILEPHHHEYVAQPSSVGPGFLPERSLTT